MFVGCERESEKNPRNKNNRIYSDFSNDKYERKQKTNHHSKQ